MSYLASPSLSFDPDRLRASLRRAVFVLASGGDPHRDVHPDAPAVRTLAGDLDAPEHRVELAVALEALALQAGGLPTVGSALAALREDGELSWRWLACALLAEEVADDEQ